MGLVRARKKKEKKKRKPGGTLRKSDFLQCICSDKSRRALCAALVGAHRTSAHPHTGARAQPEKIAEPERHRAPSKLGSRLFPFFSPSFGMSCPERLCAFSVLKRHLRVFAIVQSSTELFVHACPHLTI